MHSKRRFYLLFGCATILLIVIGLARWHCRPLYPVGYREHLPRYASLLDQYGRPMTERPLQPGDVDEFAPDEAERIGAIDVSRLKFSEWRRSCLSNPYERMVTVSDRDGTVIALKATRSYW